MLIAPMGLAVRIPVYFTAADLDSTLAPFDSTQIAPDTTTTSAPAGEIETTPDDLRAAPSGTERITKFTLAGGAGRYYREFRLGSECAAEDPTTLKQEFVEVGGEIDHQLGERGHVGIRGGMVREDVEIVADASLPVGQFDDTGEKDTYYANPYLSYERNSFGMGIGILVSSRPLYTGDENENPLDEDDTGYPTAHIRFGRLSKLYLSAHLLEGVPIYSGGGLIMVGLGGRPIPALDLYGAYSSESPYEGESFLARISLDINRSWTLMSTVRFPTSYLDYEDSEYGASLGLSYRLHRE